MATLTVTVNHCHLEVEVFTILFATERILIRITTAVSNSTLKVELNRDPDTIDIHATTTTPEKWSMEDALQAVRLKA